jgi:hypothetical protein
MNEGHMTLLYTGVIVLVLLLSKGARGMLRKMTLKEWSMLWLIFTALNALWAWFELNIPLVWWRVIDS